MYCQGRYTGYGYDFWYEEDLKLVGNTVTLANGMGDGKNWYWEKPLDCLDGKYDAGSGIITYKAAYNGDPNDTISVTLFVDGINKALYDVYNDGATDVGDVNAILAEILAQ